MLLIGGGQSSAVDVFLPNNGDDDVTIYNAEPLTLTPSGYIWGSWMQTRDGRSFEAYRGIRYAKPPVGDLRFQPPVLILNYTKSVNAREEGPACPQPIYNPEPNDYVDEDCLRLNVYTAGHKSSKLRPVIVFIHPGGFYSGSGRSDLAGPMYFMERDVVYVAINYRLGSLGFLSTGDKLAPGNNGFKDQVAALRWIQRNIAAFGGDPGLVTVTGYSAGSLSIGLHMISPMSKGLFHRAIAMSGSPISQLPIGRHQKHLAIRQARLLNCPTHSSKAIINCLKTKSFKALADSLDAMFDMPASSDPLWLWNVVLEPDFGQERFLTRQPLEAIRSGHFHPVPCIISQTQDEFFEKAFTILNNQTLLDSLNNNWEREAPIAFMLPAEHNTVQKANRLKKAYFCDRQIVNDTASADALGKLYSDAIIGFPVYKMANLMSRYSTYKVYFYEFGYIGNRSFAEDPVTKKPRGVSHHDDLLYLLSIPDIFPVIPLDSPDNFIVKKMTAIFYNFARYGNPNPRKDTPELQTLSWPAMTRKYLRIDKKFSVHRNLFEERFKTWDSLYPI